MSVGDTPTRRNVLKATGAAVTGLGVAGASASSVSASNWPRTSDGTVEVEIPYVSNTLTLEYKFTFYEDCRLDVELDVQNGAWTENNELTCDNPQWNGELDTGPAFGEISLEADFNSYCVDLEIEGCVWAAGSRCGDASVTACA